MATTTWRVRSLTATDTIATATSWRVRSLIVGASPASTTWRVRSLTATGITFYPLTMDDADGLYEPGQLVTITRNAAGTPAWQIAAVSLGAAPTLQSVGDVAYFTAPATLTGTRVTVTDGFTFIEIPIMAVTERYGANPGLPVTLWANNTF